MPHCGAVFSLLNHSPKFRSLPHRLISDNGWLNQLHITHIRIVAPSLPQVVVHLDQEKTYDRVHSEYHRCVSFHFGFLVYWCLVCLLCSLELSYQYLLIDFFLLFFFIVCKFCLLLGFFLKSIWKWCKQGSVFKPSCSRKKKRL